MLVNNTTYQAANKELPFSRSSYVSLRLSSAKNPEFSAYAGFGYEKVTWCARKLLDKNQQLQVEYLHEITDRK